MKRIHRIFLAVLSGVLLSLAWLGFPGWILFVALIPLLYLDFYFVENKAAFAGVSFWGHAFLSFLIWNTLTTWWVAYATFTGALMAIVVNSILMSVTWWLAHAARREFKKNLGYLALVVFWISFEYFHYHWDIEWPWLTLGNGFANTVKMIQWYEFTGVFGGTLWILVLNILLFKTGLNFRNKIPVKKSINLLFVLSLTLVIPLVFSFFSYYKYVEKDNPKNVVIVQPNIDPYSEKYDIKAEKIKLDNFIGLAKSKADVHTDFIVGPETVFENPGFWNEAELQGNSFVSQLTNLLENYSNAALVFGISSYKIYPDEKSASRTARRQGDLIYDRFNSAVYLNKKGDTQIYHKSKLVVGVEKMPFMNYLGFFRDLVFKIGGTSGSLGQQSAPSNFCADDGTLVAPVICYESVFGQYVSEFIRQGAQIIFIITNDGWWRNTPGFKQHLSFARLRAIETRRSIARAGNTGISCFINQRGDVAQPTNWWVEEAISGSVNTNNKITFYVKYGDYIARISLFVSVLLLLFLMAKRFR